MKLNKTLVLPLAGLLVVAAAGAALATSAGSGDTDAVVPAAESASPEPSAGTTVKPERGTALTEVLDDLVAKGTITESQKAAILDALTAEREARRAEREARRAERQERLEQMRTILEDGVITQQEFDQLPADSRLRSVEGIDDLLADGRITTDELRSLGRGFLGKGFGGRGGFGGQGWFGGGHGWFGGGPDGTSTPDAPASPAVSS